jgi:hypothetical protein
MIHGVVLAVGEKIKQVLFFIPFVSLRDSSAVGTSPPSCSRSVSLVEVEMNGASPMTVVVKEALPGLPGLLVGTPGLAMGERQSRPCVTTFKG